METFAALADWYVTADIPITRDNVKPGWVALGIVFAMGVVLVFLLRSLVRHTKRAREPWEGDEDVSQSPLDTREQAVRR